MQERVSDCGFVLGFRAVPSVLADASSLGSSRLEWGPTATSVNGFTLLPEESWLE